MAFKIEEDSKDTTEGTDYVVDLLLPNGRTISVLIPVDNDLDFTSEGEIYGLNLVTKGHYM